LESGEKEAVKQVLKYGKKYGYGNLIAYLRRDWAESLIKEYKISEELAIRITEVPPYPLDPFFISDRNQRKNNKE
jgi:hypothetical protein